MQNIIVYQRQFIKKIDIEQCDNSIVSLHRNQIQVANNINDSSKSKYNLQAPSYQNMSLPEKKQFVNQYMAQKAGMSNVNKDKISQIVQKLTQGSPKSLYEQQMSQKRQLQLVDMLSKVLEFTIQQKRQIKQDWLQEIQKMNKQRDLTKYWAHLDFDMFYVACEMLDKPQLKDKPTAVGGQYSVICTANYVARKYGVRSALPTFIAKKLCPEIILIPPDFTKYKKFSNIFRDILRRYDPQLESMGLDEAYVQLTQYMKDKTLEEQQKFIDKIRQDIFEQTGLTVSCGVGANKMLAKLASQQNKPNGQFILQNNGQKIVQFMKTKKIRKIPGIGPVNEFFLKGLGIETAQDMLNNTDVLSICFSTNSTQFYISRALGLGSTQHQFVQRKSLGKSQTFKATNDLEFLFNKIYEICEQISMELQQLGYVTKNVVFSYQNENYSKKDKTFQLNKYTSNKADLAEHILPYLNNFIETRKQKIRLLGARCTSIIKIEDLKKMQLDKFLVNKQNTDDDPNRTESQQIARKKKQTSKLIGSMIQFLCPICNQEIDCKGNLTAFNRHIDKCMMEQDNIKQEHNDLIPQSKQKQPTTKQSNEKEMMKRFLQKSEKNHNKSLSTIETQKAQSEKLSKKNSGNLLSFLRKKQKQ